MRRDGVIFSRCFEVSTFLLPSPPLPVFGCFGKNICGVSYDYLSRFFRGKRRYRKSHLIVPAGCCHAVLELARYALCRSCVRRAPPFLIIVKSHFSSFLMPGGRLFSINSKFSDLHPRETIKYVFELNADIRFIIPLCIHTS